MVPAVPLFDTQY